MEKLRSILEGRGYTIGTEFLNNRWYISLIKEGDIIYRARLSRKDDVDDAMLVVINEVIDLS